MRTAVIVAIAIGSTGCVHSAFYHAGPHSFATLDRSGDGYVALSRGWVPTAFYDGQGESRDVQGAYALGPVALHARAFTATKPMRGNDGHLDQSEVELGLGLRSKATGALRTQSLLAISRASSDATLRGDPFGGGDDSGPPHHRAVGRYWRVYAQYSSVVRRRYVDVGAAIRVSTVHADRFQRRAPDASTSPYRYTLPNYTIVMPDTGSRTGVFMEPGILFRFGYKGVKFGPEFSFAQPLFKTAFAGQRFNLSASLSFNIEPSRTQ